MMMHLVVGALLEISITMGKTLAIDADSMLRFHHVSHMCKSRKRPESGKYHLYIDIEQLLIPAPERTKKMTSITTTWSPNFHVSSSVKDDAILVVFLETEKKMTGLRSNKSSNFTSSLSVFEVDFVSLTAMCGSLHKTERSDKTV